MAAATRYAHHMSDEDALMWNIEKDPILRSTIVAVALFDKVPDWDRLRERIGQSTLLIPRFRQRAVSPPFRIGPPRWTVERSFDLDYHLRRTRLPAPGTIQTLLEALQPIATSSFDRARPLWEFTLFEGLAGPEGERAAIAMKVHHSVTDGVGGMELLTHLVDLERDASNPSPETLPAAPAPEHLGTIDLVRDSLAHTRRRIFGVVRRMPGTAVRVSYASVRHPVGTTREAVRTTRSIARALAPATAPMSPVMRDRGLGRRLATIDLPMDDLRRAAKAVEGSLNDVFVTGVVLGLQRYHERHGAQSETLRMTLPINLRQRHDDAAGNRFAPARFPVPTTIEDPRVCAAEIRKLVKEWRAEPSLQMTTTLAGVLNRLPTAATTALFGGMLKCCDFVTSNVPGAPVPVYSAGARVERLYAFGPPSGAALNVTLISHCDVCCLGIVADTTAIPDPDVLVACLRAGFDQLFLVD
jgi:WS/DGAT/MGAT family acyltransferase